MAEIVGAFCLPHAASITAQTERAQPAQAARVFAAFEQIRREVELRRADTVLVVGRHDVPAGPGPELLIATGSLEGPVEPELRIERRPVAGNPPLARHLLRNGQERGFDFAATESPLLDHSVMIPVHLAVPYDVNVVPIHLVSGAEPGIGGRRCHELGALLRSAVEAWPGPARVVVFGSGGLSHRAGAAGTPAVNPAFDGQVLRLVENGDVAGLSALSDDYIAREGGDGALGLRSWMVAMGAMPGCRGRVVAYEAVEAWGTGLGFAELTI
jgi:protocatechuate 4,5-dioxygenase beta chain